MNPISKAGRRGGSSIYKIYALLDPRDSPPSVRYVGCTQGSVDTRFSLHISEALSNRHDRPKDEWIRDVIKDNHEPLFMLLEKLDAKDDWEAREKLWIARYAGPDLTNVAAGGSGSLGALRTEKRKKEVGDFFRGQPLREEHKEKIRQSKLGIARPAHVKEAMLQANIGRKQSQETIDKRKATILANGGYSRSEYGTAKKALSVRKSNSSGCPGVRVHKTSGLWQARITIKGKEISLGYHKEYEDAVAARREAELEHYGKTSI